MPVSDAVAVGCRKTISDTVGRALEALDGRLLLVGINVELDEQEQITGQNTTSKQGSSLCSSAVSHVRRVPVSSGVPGVGYRLP